MKAWQDNSHQNYMDITDLVGVSHGIRSFIAKVPQRADLDNSYEIHTRVIQIQIYVTQ